MRNTRKNVPWKGWKNEKPGYHQKTTMRKRCGQKCFLHLSSLKTLKVTLPFNSKIAEFSAI